MSRDDDTELADRRVFLVDDSAWEELQELLSRPPALPPAMVKLLSNLSLTRDRLE